MHRLAFVLALFLTTSAFAAATSKFTVTNAGWTDLGAGPLQLTFRGAGVYAIGDANPSTFPLASEGFRIVSGDSVNVRTPSHVWATAQGSANVDVYVAPIN